MIDGHNIIEGIISSFDKNYFHEKAEKVIYYLKEDDLDFNMMSLNLNERGNSPVKN